MIFKKRLITKKLELTDGQFLALAILSGNDYAQNIPQIGIGRVFNFNKKLNTLQTTATARRATTTTSSSTTTAAAITSKIVSNFEIRNDCSGHFNYAKDVFVSLQENDLSDNEMFFYNEKVSARSRTSR